MRILLSALLLLSACGGPEPTPPAATLSDEEPAALSEAPPRVPEGSASAADADADPADADPADAGPDADAARDPAPPRAPSVSMGSPNYGDLRNGVPLPIQGRGFVHNARRRREARYGTREMVDALVSAAAVVARELPGGELTINDLGFETGGPISQHGSHQAGRDVDVLFYLLDAEGSPRAGVGAPIDPEGRGTDYRDLAVPDDDLALRIDLPRTWRFVQALIEDEDAALQRIFVVEHLRSMLLAHAQAIGAPAQAIERFGEMTCQPSAPHDDHFHFRFYCSDSDIGEGCEDKTPIFGWRRRQLAALGLEATMAGPRRRRAPTTSAAEARAAAGELHPSVVAFLELREAWSRKPHPGRAYCR